MKFGSENQENELWPANVMSKRKIYAYLSIVSVQRI